MTPLYIHGFGAISAVGLDAERTVASLRSGIDGFRIVPFWGESEEDLQVARIAGYAEAVAGSARFETLALRALVPALADLPAGRREKVILFLGLPVPVRPGVPKDLGQWLQGRLAERLDSLPENVRPLERGRASTYLALREAARHCPAGYSCIVGGVDCLVDPVALQELSRALLLKEEWDGFIPGEGAAFVRLSAQPAEGPWGRASTKVIGVGIALEEADNSAAKPLIGVGVRKAFQAAAIDAGRTDAQIELCVNDVNGARAAFEDEAYGWVRFFRTQRADRFIEVWHPASYVGETGAAAGAIALIWASSALELGFHPAKYVLLSASEGNTRAAVILEHSRQSATPGPRQAFAAIQVGVDVPALHPLELPQRPAFEGAKGLPIKGLDRLHRELIGQNLDGVATLLTIILQHHAQGTAPWGDLTGFEDRLVAHLDALGWGGSDSREVAREQVRSEEPDEAAAAALALASFELDAVDRQMVIDAALSSGEHAVTLPLACAYAPKASARALLEGMLAYSKLVPAALEAALVVDVLRPDQLDALVPGADANLADHLIRAYAWLAGRNAWPVVGYLLDRHSTQWDVHTMLAALAASPSQSEFSSSVGVRDFARSPMVWTFACHRWSASPVEGWPHGPTPLSGEAIAALGWSGESAAQPLLMEGLLYEDEAVRQEAARALSRIYGHAPTEKVEVVVDEESGSTARVTRLSLEPSVWRPLLAATPHPPLRYGVPLSRDRAVVSLMRSDIGTRDRMIAAWEHIVMTGGRAPVHPRTFVRQQLRKLADVSA